MPNHEIILEFLGVPDSYVGLLDDFFSQVSSTIAQIGEFEIKPEEVTCFPHFNRSIREHGSTPRIFIRYGTTSSALLDPDWKSHAHSRIVEMVKKKFETDSVQRFE